MKALNKQTVLTGALFAILAANVSFKTEMQSIDLAQSAPEARGSSVIPGRASISTSSHDVEIVPSSPNGITASATGIQPARGLGPQALKPESLLACGKQYEIKFEEGQSQGQPIVRGLISLNGTDVEKISYFVSAEDLLKNASDKDKFLAGAKKKVQERECSDSKTETASSKEAEKAKRREEVRAEKIARGQRNCTLDSDAKPLKGDERYNCNLERLETSVEVGDEDLDLDEDSERTERRRVRLESKGAAQFKSALLEIKESIKSLLLSENEMKEEDGLDRVEEVVSTLRDMEATREVSSALIRKAILEVNALKKADRFDEHSVKLAENYELIQERKNELISLINTSMDPYTSMALGQQLRQLESIEDQTEIGIKGDTQYRELMAMRAQGILSQDDVLDFTPRYQELLAMISGSNTTVTGSNPITLTQVPQGAQEHRRQTLNSGRDYGVALPPYPSSNIQVATAGQYMPNQQQPYMQRQQMPNQQPNMRY